MNTVKSLLSQLCGTTDDVRRDIESQLKKHFIDPFYVSRSNSLPDNDVMKKDAQIVSDAFEAVTNGMYDEDVLQQLSSISDNSFFTDWKHLTESLYYLYKENFKKSDENFSKIKEDSIPYLISPVFYRIISREKISSINGLSDTEKQFINNIIKDSITVKTSLDQIETNLKTGKEERFTDNITLLLSDLCSKDRDLSKKLAAWGLKQLSQNDMSPAILLENLKLIFGESESFRLTAVSFRDEDPELSLVFFTKALLVLLRNNSAEQNQVEAYIEIITDLLVEIERTAYEAEGEPDSGNATDDEMADQINNILIVLEKEISLLFPHILEDGDIRNRVLDKTSRNNPPENEKEDISSYIKKTSVHTSAENSDNKIPAASHKKREKTEKPVQLELFF